jgi:hypothetical protein
LHALLSLGNKFLRRTTFTLYATAKPRCMGKEASP